MHTTWANDPVNSPNHYTRSHPGMECIELTADTSFCLGNAIKYTPDGGHIAITAGSNANAETPLITLNLTDRGYTVKISVTNEQAKKVKVGDTAELVNFWGGDAVATLDQITNSQSSGNRTLVFTLTGDIQAGQNITLSIGQKSANYDALIPLSGLREDSNGKFVYVLQSKNSPLGSRYIATRVTVQELARDDKSAAVSGISQGDFIITTSNKPVEAGKQVRLADNG